MLGSTLQFGVYTRLMFRKEARHRVGDDTVDEVMRAGMGGNITISDIDEETANEI